MLAANLSHSLHKCLALTATLCLLAALAYTCAVVPAAQVYANPPEASSLAQQVIELANTERAAQGLPPLKLQDNLQSAAMWIAQDNATYNYFSHTDRFGRGIEQRFTDFGYTGYSIIGENLHAGSIIASDAVTSWMNSPGHRANILNGSFCEIGAGYSYNANSAYQRYWSQTFGCRFNVYPVIINREAAQTTSAAVNLYIYGSGWAQEMRLSNDGVNWTAWETYQSSRAWTLSGGSGTRTVYVDLRNGTTVRSANDSILLNGATATPTLTATPAVPPEPSNLVVSGSTAASISLAWQDNATNEQGFRIYKWGNGTNGWNFYPLTTVGANTTTFTETGLACGGVEYFYLITAFNGTGESAATPFVKGVTLDCPTATPTQTHTTAPTQTHTATPVVTSLVAPWSDSLESGTTNWISSGLWHIAQDNISPYPLSYSPTRSWWYGQNTTGTYNTGATNSGAITGPPVLLPGTITGAQLSFWSWHKTESSTNFDQRLVQLSVDDGAYITLGQMEVSPMEGWQQHTSDFSG